jgi:hypothetical protein
MGKRKLNWRLVKRRRNYSIEEIASLFDVHKNTVSAMRKAGLQPIDDSRPMLFQGEELAAFLRDRQAKNKQSLLRSQMYCLGCRAAREPAFGEVECHSMMTGSANLRALCSTCAGLMHRRVSTARLHVVPAKWRQAVEQSATRIGSCSEPSVICDFEGALSL